ncbi:MAG: PAS domain S-box protein, partial [Spirochaetaceae bacterium]
YILSFFAIILNTIFIFDKKNTTLKKTAITMTYFFTSIVVVGIVSEIILPFMGIDFPETSNVAIAIGFIPIGYLVWKNKIFDISPETAVDNILGSMTDSLILVNHEGKIRFANQAASDLLEYTQMELQDKTFMAIIPADENTLASMGSEKGIQALDGIHYLESAFLTKYGKIIPVSISLSQLFMKGNSHTLGFVCIARDITERRKREAELEDYRHHLEDLVRLRTAKLRENYQRYITLFHESPSALLEVNLKTLFQKLDELRELGCRDIIGFCMEHPLQAIRLIRHLEICQVNRSLLQLFDVENQQNVSSGLHMLLRKKSFIILMSILESLFNGDLEVETNGVIYRPDFSERFVIMRLSMVEDGDQTYKRAIVSIVDITAQKRALEERAELEEQLRHVQKMEALGILAGGIAHDFNNLLTGIHGYSDIVKHELGPASPLNKEMDIIETTVHKAAGLVRQLLNFARKGKQHNVVFDMHMIIDEVMTILKHSIDKRIRIVRELEAEQAFITGDPGQIEQVIVNLSVNA